MMRPLMHTVVANIRASAAARWMTVRQLRLETRARLSERRASRYRARRAASAVRSRGHQTGDAWLEGEVLRMIGRHPEGICAFDIGNKLGVDWRRVPAMTTRLIEGGIVEQVDQDFYLVGKAR